MIDFFENLLKILYSSLMFLLNFKLIFSIIILLRGIILCNIMDRKNSGFL